MPTPLDFEAILARRDEVFRQLASLGDLRPGSLVARFRNSVLNCQRKEKLPCPPPRQLASLGDLRPGSLVARFKCGKPNCHCAAEGAPGHGPSWSLTRGVRGKTVTRVIPADAVDLAILRLGPGRCRPIRDVRSDRRVPSLAPADRGTDRGQRAIM